jgi:hypothetical protein
MKDAKQETESKTNATKEDASQLLESLKCVEDEANTAKANAHRLLASLAEA